MIPTTRTHRPLLLFISLALVAATLFVGVANPAPANAAGLSDRGALTVHQGSLTVRNDGAVIENLEIRGTLRIEASNVVVRNVWVYTKNSWSIYVASGSATFDNIEVGHPSHIGERGIGGANVTVRNADIHHVEDGIKLGSNAFYSNVRVHDLASLGAGPHADAIQVEGTARNSVVQNSYLDATGPVGLGNAAIIIKSDLGPQSNLTFKNNYMNGGNYTIYLRDGGHGVPSNVKFEGNSFGPDRRYGLMVADGPYTWTNNTWASNGAVISQPGNAKAPSSSGFNDISNSVHKDNILKLVSLGIASTGSSFRPADDVTRGQMAAFLTRALNLKSTSKDYFSDDSASIFEDDINALAAAGIASTTSSKYRPDDPVRRGQVAAFLTRAFGFKKGGSTPFTDIGDTIFRDDIAGIYRLGITVGTSPTTYSPNTRVTRGQVATFLVRALNAR